MGATAVIHSITKYLAGHGDVTGGVVAVSEEYAAGLSLLGRLVGGVLSPFESFLALRGLKTLPLRFERQSHSAARIAVELEDHPYVKRVYYPGLPSHPDHDLVQRLFGSFPLGGVLSFEIKRLDREAAFTFLRQLKLVQSATTLGDVCSLALYPVMSSHRALSSAQRHEAGISDGLIRLSIGLEDPEDILADLDQALRGVRI
jgi:cystathionine gamma-synthase/methionine-gamma-lyase